jgi:hypothetical protein
LQEAVGKKTKAKLKIADVIPLSFAPFEIKTLRIEKDGTWRDAALVEETPT